MFNFDVLFGLKLCEKILKVTDNLSKTLHKQSLSAAEAQHDSIVCNYTGENENS